MQPKGGGGMPLKAKCCIYDEIATRGGIGEVKEQEFAKWAAHVRLWVSICELLLLSSAVKKSDICLVFFQMTNN